MNFEKYFGSIILLGYMYGLWTVKLKCGECMVYYE